MAALVGFLAVALPAILRIGWVAPSFLLSREGVSHIVENLQFLPSCFLLLVAGLFFGATHPRRAWGLAFFMVVPFLAAMALDIVMSPKSHNLWPLELLVYCILLLPALIGAFLGSVLRKRTRRNTRA